EGSSVGSSLGSSVGPGAGSEGSDVGGSLGFTGIPGDTLPAGAGSLALAESSSSHVPTSEHSGDEWAAATEPAPRVVGRIRTAAARIEAVRRLGALMQSPPQRLRTPSARAVPSR